MSTVKLGVFVLACNLFTMVVVAIRGDLVATALCVVAVFVSSWALRRAIRGTCRPTADKRDYVK